MNERELETLSNSVRAELQHMQEVNPDSDDSCPLWPRSSHVGLGWRSHEELLLLACLLQHVKEDVVLFGSRAKRSQHPYSDIDLMPASHTSAKAVHEKLRIFAEEDGPFADDPPAFLRSRSGCCWVGTEPPLDISVREPIDDMPRWRLENEVPEGREVFGVQLRAFRSTVEVSA